MPASAAGQQARTNSDEALKKWAWAETRVKTTSELALGNPETGVFFHKFSGKTKNMHLIGSLYFGRKWKVFLARCSASVAYYKYARKEKLFCEILVINLNEIKRHLTNEKPITCRSPMVEPRAHPFFFLQTTASIIDFCSVFNMKSLSLPALVKSKSNSLLNITRPLSNFLFAVKACDEVQVARFWL